MVIHTAIKVALSNLLRRMHLLSAVDKARYYIIRIIRRKQTQQFIKQNPGIALPPPYYIYETFQLNYEKYYLGGHEVAEWIKGKLSEYSDLQVGRILDWGCGPGRVTRHLPAVFRNADVYGCDYNEDYVRWCTANLPGITVKKCGVMPPLPFEDGHFDLIISISIFTHLSESAHFLWAEELCRVLRPSGIALITTMGNAYGEQLGPGQLAKYDAGKLVTKENTREGHRTYAAYQPPSWFANLMKKYFEVLGHEPGKTEPWGLDQDKWIVRRKAG